MTRCSVEFESGRCCLGRGHSGAHQTWGPITKAEPERLDMARERIRDLESAVEADLVAMGPCDDADSDEPLCNNPTCTYCNLARAAQPQFYGHPLIPVREG